MGVDSRFAMELITDVHLTKGKANAVMLGRQGFVAKPRYYSKLRQRLRAAGIKIDPSTVMEA